MAAAAVPLVFNTRFEPAVGMPEEVAPGVVRVTAPNRGPYTFTGTNSFLLGGDRLAVLDPGPEDEAHLRALLRAIGGRKVDAILLTHTHKDHSALAPRLKAATGAPIWFGGRHRLSRRPRPFEWNAVDSASDWDLIPERTLADGESLEVAGMRIEVVATPGHCANHICFGLSGTGWLLSGDHVMGWNSTLVSVPDGSMADYLASLRKLIALPYITYLPAHGGPIEDGPAYAHALLAHREMRNAQIVAAVKGGARRIGDLLKTIYPKLSLPLVPAARMVLRAHVEYLEAAGIIAVRRGPLGMTFRPA
jgi:glyoxylase-like metal-dependent hydrolase (beta-lactamase superfamily II)